MTVRPVTPRVTAISGHLAFYRDADHFDAFTDALATGDDIYTSDVEIPSGRGLRRFNHLTTRPSNERPAPSASSASLIHASGDREGGRYARTPEAQSSPAAPADCPGSNATGGPALLLPAGSPTPLEDVEGPSGGHRSAQ